MSERRILLLTASVGAGHVRAAEAVRDAILERVGAGGSCAVEVVDILPHTRAPFRAIYRDGYLAMIRFAPRLLGALFRGVDEPRPKGRRAWSDRVTELACGTGIARLLRERRPTSVVCTHFLPGEIVSRMIRAGELDARFSIVVTDIDAHAIWIVDPCERYFVAGDSARTKLRSFGIDDDRITISGIPIDPVFRSPPSRAEARAELGIESDRPVLLLSGGGVGVGPLVETATALARLGTPLTLIAVAGRNPAALAKLQALSTALGPAHPARLVPIGFTSRMHVCMAASELLIGKPGGLTSSEALACGLPLAIVAPVPGQEERNAEHLLELGVAVRCRDASDVATAVRSLLARPETLAEMAARARNAARPNAAETIAQAVLDADSARRPNRLAGRASAVPA